MSARKSPCLDAWIANSWSYSHAFRLSSDFANAQPPLFVLYNHIITQCVEKARFMDTDFAGECGLSNGVDI